MGQDISLILSILRITGHTSQFTTTPTTPPPPPPRMVDTDSFPSPPTTVYHSAMDYPSPPAVFPPPPSTDMVSLNLV